MIEVEIEEKFAEELLEQMENKADRMNNVLKSFQSNSLTTCGNHYDRLLDDRQELLAEIEDLRKQLVEGKQEENEEEEMEEMSEDLSETNESKGLSDLFSGTE